MKYNREFEIPWQGLKLGPSTYSYEIDDQFMKERGAEEGLENWKAVVTLVFDKHENFFMLKFDIDGSVTVPCDRCGDEYKMRLWDEFNLVIKLISDDAPEIEDEDDVIFIPRSETVLDVSNWIYEFVLLSVPIQKIHPDNADGTPGCNQAALDLLNKLTDNGDDDRKVLWKGLDKLKN